VKGRIQGVRPSRDWKVTEYPSGAMARRAAKRPRPGADGAGAILRGS